MTERKEAKRAITVRIDPKRIAELKSMAKAQGSTTSALIDLAVERFLGPNSAYVNTELVLTGEDLKSITPVIQAVGKPVRLSLFLELVQVQRGSRSS